MSEELTYPFTDEQIGNMATTNANGVLLAVTAFAKENSIPIDEMWRSIGQKFAPGWEGMRGSPVSEIAKWFALVLVSYGAELLSLSEDEMQSQFVITGWPSAESLEYWGLSQNEADAAWSSGAPIAEHLGLSYKLSRDGDELTFLFSRPGAD